MELHIGLDVGSTTVKLVVLDENFNTLYSVYRRHKSDVKQTVTQVIREAYPRFKNDCATINVTGSGGMFVEKYLGINFVQEVVAETRAIKEFIPNTDVVIELGGEDSKITYLKGSVEQRMNSICAGGTGAFIDQMASLLNTDASGLNELAKGYNKIYPIASRCGVFAKTDVQALMNEGASRNDIAISVFQSVVNQTISNLACGRPIRGNVTFLGGPLHFLSTLRDRFVETLGEDENTFYTPDDGQIYVAKGAAILSSETEKSIPYLKLIQELDKDNKVELFEQDTMEPLFTSKEEYEKFVEEHKTTGAKYRDIETYEGEIYVGIDAGSTTSKIIMISEDNEILFTDYRMNLGRPLEVVIDMLKEAYKKINDKARIVSSGICGYGEEFIKKALKIDNGEVETIAHYEAAKYFDPNVDFILDIGGQDMKAMHIRDGIIDSIQLNESCSSGCGSFLSTFSASIGMNVADFQKEALFAKNPADLGSRCTVFMNSKVKQAQKEGSEVSDIAAGLCYSVIKNALQKVIKVRDPQKLGTNLVVQGGTFYGDAILRAFEKISGRKTTRPEIAGLMGAMGMALIAKKNSTGVSTLASYEDIEDFRYKQINARCGKCTNNCALTVNIFPDGERYITGNRCERGQGIAKENTLSDFNMYKFKNHLLFDRVSLGEDNLFGSVGIPRALNMYENYPFWHTFFTKLGFNVILSDESKREIYEKGIESISSETACYPAKLVHGHIENLIDKNVDMIFYPAVFFEQKQFDKAQNHMNCPVVSGYPNVIENNVESLKNVKYMAPHLSFSDKKTISKRLEEVFTGYTYNGNVLKKSAIKNAVNFAWDELEEYHRQVKNKGKEIIDYINKNDMKAIVLAGRPYHIDPEVNHGIPELIEGMKLPVLSEDAISYNLDDLDHDTRVLDQWTYHARLYRAAKFVAQSDNLELVQLNSFGCGLDAVTTDQVQEILEANGKIYTVLKIDEVSNLGAVKIRIRSLIQALNEKQKEGKTVEAHPEIAEYEHVEFTPYMKEGYTILAPQMAREHFQILEEAFKSDGFNIEFLDKVDRDTIDQGLKYVNNDSCYPSITVVGQFMQAIHSGKYDTDRLALLMSQTGGACRASNYVGYIRKALKDAGYPNIPVIALSAQGIESNSGFQLSLPFLKKAMISIMLGDLINRVTNATRPYEYIKGSTNLLKDKWMDKCKREIKDITFKRYKELVNEIVEDFDNLEVKDIKLPKAGIVGEILVKYLPEANNHLQRVLEDEGAEVVLPDLTDFLMYCLRNSKHKAQLYNKSKFVGFMGEVGVKLIEVYRKPAREALRRSKRFEEPLYIEQIEEYAKEITSLGNQAGEGWLLSGEMIELIHSGASNIVCIQPFGCLPNHITGKGVMKKIRELYPNANLVAIDYDSGASEVNQINRIKLMMSQAKENMKKDLINTNKDYEESIIGNNK